MSVTVKNVVLSNNGQWWVVNTSPSLQDTVYTVIEGTQSQALGYPNGGGISGPYTSLAQADSVARNEPPNASATGKDTGTGIIAGALIGGGAGNESPSSAISNASAINNALGHLDILGGFNVGAWFLRIGEILLGLVLVGVGVARITGIQNVVSKVVKTKL